MTGIPMHHPATDGTTIAVNEAQAAVFETRGWERTPAPEDEAPTVVHFDTAAGLEHEPPELPDAVTDGDGDTNNTPDKGEED